VSLFAAESADLRDLVDLSHVELLGLAVIRHILLESETRLERDAMKKRVMIKTATVDSAARVSRLRAELRGVTSLEASQTERKLASNPFTLSDVVDPEGLAVGVPGVFALVAEWAAKSSIASSLESPHDLCLGEVLCVLNSENSWIRGLGRRDRATRWFLLHVNEFRGGLANCVGLRSSGRRVGPQNGSQSSRNLWHRCVGERFSQSWKRSVLWSSGTGEEVMWVPWRRVLIGDHGRAWTFSLDGWLPLDVSEHHIVFWIIWQDSDSDLVDLVGETTWREDGRPFLLDVFPLDGNSSSDAEIRQDSVLVKQRMVRFLASVDPTVTKVRTDQFSMTD